MLSIGARGLSKSILFIFPLFLSLYHRDFLLSFITCLLSSLTKEIHVAPPPDLFAGVLWKQTLRSALPACHFSTEFQPQEITG